MTDINPSLEWFEFASHDFESAKFLAEEMQKIPIEIVCFHCQQSAEKYLKGYLVDKGILIEKTHDLTSLCNQCEEFNSDFSQFEDDCDMLAIFAARTRYPSKIEITEADMNVALQIAERIKDFVLSKYVKPTQRTKQARSSARR